MCNQTIGTPINDAMVLEVLVLTSEYKLVIMMCNNIDSMTIILQRSIIVIYDIYHDIHKLDI